MTTMTIKFDVETGDVITVLKNDKEEVKPIPLAELVLKGLTSNPSTVISSQASPRCITYIVNGKYYRV